MRNLQKGFTLIELMIVVAIIGILAAIAIPQYQDYITRAKWQDNISRVQSFKTAVAECLQNNNGSLSECDTAAKVISATGAAPLPASGGNVLSMDYGATNPGQFTIVGTPAVGSCTVLIIPSAGTNAVTWSYQNIGTGCGKSKTGVGTG
jgi:type IV pilus assembly protein PilA